MLRLLENKVDAGVRTGAEMVPGEQIRRGSEKIKWKGRLGVST